jgi:hypothetical protein
MGWALAGAAVVVGVYYGAKYLASHRDQTPAPHDPPPQTVDMGDAGADGGVH